MDVERVWSAKLVREFSQSTKEHFRTREAQSVNITWVLFSFLLPIMLLDSPLTDRLWEHGNIVGVPITSFSDCLCCIHLLCWCCCVPRTNQLLWWEQINQTDRTDGQSYKNKTQVLFLFCFCFKIFHTVLYLLTWILKVTCTYRINTVE